MQCRCLSIGKAEIHLVGSLALGDLPLSSCDITPPADSFQKVLFAVSSWSEVTAAPAGGRQALASPQRGTGVLGLLSRGQSSLPLAPNRFARISLGLAQAALLASMFLRPECGDHGGLRQGLRPGYSGLRAGHPRTFFQRANPASSAQTLFL